MHGTIPQAERAHGILRDLPDCSLLQKGEAGGSHVDRLFEEGAVERVGLVEEGEDVEPAGHEQPLERHFGSGDELFD